MRLPYRPPQPARGSCVLEHRRLGIEPGHGRKELSAAAGERRIGEVRHAVVSDASRLSERGGALRLREARSGASAARVQPVAGRRGGPERRRPFDSGNDRPARVRETRDSVRAHARCELERERVTACASSGPARSACGRRSQARHGRRLRRAAAPGRHQHGQHRRSSGADANARLVHLGSVAEPGQPPPALLSASLTFAGVSPPCDAGRHVCTIRRTAGERTSIPWAWTISTVS